MPEFSNLDEFQPLKVDNIFVNSADPDVIPHCAALRLGLHCSLNYPVAKVFSYNTGT